MTKPLDHLQISVSHPEAWILATVTSYNYPPFATTPDTRGRGLRKPLNRLNAFDNVRLS